MGLDFPGFSLDQARAEALARQLRPVLLRADEAEVPVQDQLAALGLAAAALIAHSGLRRQPAFAANALAGLVQQAVVSGALPF